MSHKTINEMRYELEQFAPLSADTPDDMIRGLYQCYKMATDERLPQAIRSTAEFLFTTFESGNGRWALMYREKESLFNRNPEFDGDMVGRYDD